MTWLIMIIGVFLGLLFGIFVDVMDAHFNKKEDK